MSKLWQWFLAHGDKLLGSLAVVALSPQVAPLLPSWASVILGSLAVAHIIVLPEPGAAAAPPTAATVAKMLAFIIVGGFIASNLTACKTTPTQTQQAGIAVGVDIAVGLAVQSGSSDPAQWKARAAQFEQAAKAVQALNAQGVVTSLATLMADLQPYIAKLGPADVLAANALVAALTPILQAQLGTNPTLATTQADLAIVLGDIVTACSAYTGS